VPALTVLVVEDDANLRFVVSAALRLAGFDVVEATDGRTAVRIVDEAAPDLLILDVMLGEPDGFEVCDQLRAAGHDVPVMFLTARDATEDRVRGLTIGGDDYLTKPFSVEELVARVRAILRRAGRINEEQVLRCGGVVLSESAHRVTCEGMTVELSPTEYKLLRFMLGNAGRALTRGQILDHVWEYDFDGESSVVETFVSTLRKKLGPGAALIQTVRGVGYRMAEL